ncbi:hypothetical protein GCM10010336_19900 [Streptomyces goshikiensis]|nr:hypothetical protein GCM10010336_19900 [Streptomyces goshikiensis]
MLEVARVGAAQREQDVQVGAAEVGVEGGLAADPGAQAQVAAEQRGSSTRSGKVMPSAFQGVCGVTRYSSGARLRVRTFARAAAASTPPSARGMEQQPASQLWPERSM